MLAASRVNIWTMRTTRARGLMRRRRDEAAGKKQIDERAALGGAAVGAMLSTMEILARSS